MFGNLNVCNEYMKSAANDLGTLASVNPETEIPSRPRPEVWRVRGPGELHLRNWLPNTPGTGNHASSAKLPE